MIGSKRMMGSNGMIGGNEMMEHDGVMANNRMTGWTDLDDNHLFNCFSKSVILTQCWSN